MCAQPGPTGVTELPAPLSLPVSLQSIPLIPATTVSSGPTLNLPAIPTPSMTPSSALGVHSSTFDPKSRLAPFKFANSNVPIPSKLVKKIQAFEYIDMHELLLDNIALSERLIALPPGLAPPKPLDEREIEGDRTLVTWVSSFATYVAIIAEAHPGRVCDMLAYMRLVMREASKFGGTSWLTYDAVFRRNHEGGSTPWNYIDALLHQVYIASQGNKAAIPCKHCHESDHPSAECYCFNAPQGPGITSRATLVTWT